MPEYVRSSCNITWMSAHERVGHGSTRTGVVVCVADRSGEPPEWDRVVLENKPAPRDFEYEVRECAGSVLCQPPKHGWWRDVLMVSEGNVNGNGRDKHGLVPHGKTPIPTGNNSNTNWLATDI